MQALSDSNTAGCIGQSQKPPDHPQKTVDNNGQEGARAFQESGVATVEVYDPATDTWEQGADMPAPRRAFAISEVDGKIYVVGGRPSQGMRSQQTVFMYKVEAGDIYYRDSVRLQSFEDDLIDERQWQKKDDLIASPESISVSPMSEMVSTQVVAGH